MKAIQIKYLSATDHRGARLKAISGAGCIMQDRDYALNFVEQAERLAEEYIAKKQWQGMEVSGTGTLPNGDFVATVARA